MTGDDDDDDGDDVMNNGGTGSGARMEMDGCAPLQPFVCVWKGKKKHHRGGNGSRNK